MEKLQLRILIQHIQGETINYFYNRESFDQLNIEKYDNSQFIEIGNTFYFEDVKYIVKDINFKMEEQLCGVDNSKGVSMRSSTEPSEYNCRVAIFVDNT